MANDILNPYQQFLDDAGNPVSSGTLTFYDNLTTTPNTDIYSDEALSVQVVTVGGVYELDASGRTTGDVKYNGLRSILLKNSSGGSVRTYNNVASSGGGGSDVTTYDLGTSGAGTASASTNSGISVGHIIKTNYHNSSLIAGSGSEVAYDGNDTLAKASLWPDPATGIFHDVTGKHYLIINLSNVSQCGAIGGATDDSGAFKAAVTNGGEFDLLATHNVGAGAITINSDIIMRGIDPFTVITQDSGTELFINNTNNVNISRVQAAGYDFLLNSVNFEKIEVHHNHITGVAASTTEFGLLGSGTPTGETVYVHHNYFKDIGPMIMDNMVCTKEVRMEYNEVVDANQYVCRALAAAPYHGNVYFNHNTVIGINTGIVDVSALYARLVQVQSQGVIEIVGNECTNFSTGQSGTIVYATFGEMDIRDNRFANMQGNNYLIRDKGHAVTEKHQVVNNVFDQTDCTVCNLEGIMHGHALSNVLVSENKYIGCLYPALAVFKSEDTGVWPSNIVFSDNQFMNHKHPYGVFLQQGCSNIAIQNNVVHLTGDPTAIGLTQGFVVMNLSSDGWADIEDITIQDNVIIDADAAMHIVVISTNPIATDSIHRIKVLRNTMKTGASAIHGIGTGHCCESATLEGNIIPYDADPFSGVLPLNIRGKQLVDLYVALYDFDVHGGAVSTIELTDAESIPNNAVITRAWYEVATAPTSGGLATISIGVTANDPAGITLVTAFDDAIYGLGFHDGIPDNTAANFTTKTTATRTLSLAVAGAALTAGKIRVWVEYVLAE